jgi:hypothetical protein
MKMGSGPGGGTIGLSLGFAIKSAAADGTRQAAMLVHFPMMRMMDGKKLDVTISPSGAVTVGSTGEIKAHYSPSQMKEASTAAQAPMMQMFLNALNWFADGCAAAPSQKVGTSWHAFNTFVQSDIVYTVTGHEQQAGHDTIAVTMKSAGGGMSLSGQGNYDPVAHLVVSVHSQLQQAPGTPAQVVDAQIATP